MNESGYIRTVHQHLPPSVYRWKVHSAYNNGVPDCYYSAHPYDMWIEYKLLRDEPGRHTPKLTEMQKQWLRSRHEEGRKVVVVVGLNSGKTNVILENLEWESQVLLNSKTRFTRKELAQWIYTQLTGAVI